MSNYLSKDNVVSILNKVDAKLNNRYTKEESIEALSSKESKFRYTTMPEANASMAGQIVEFTGTTTQTYKKGLFYECKPQGTDPETYAWEEAKVQSDPSINGISSTNIKSINAEFNSDYTLKRVYAIIDDGLEIKPFASSTDAEIAEILRCYYKGILTLDQIKAVWHLGDKRSVGSGLPQYQIIDFAHDNLTTAINGKTKALLTLGCVSNTSVSNKYNLYTYGGSAIDTYLQNTYYNGLSCKNIIKSVTKVCNTGNVDRKVFIESVTELNGSTTITEGSQYEAYKQNIIDWSAGAPVKTGEYTKGVGLRTYPQYVYYNSFYAGKVIGMERHDADFYFSPCFCL